MARIVSTIEGYLHPKETTWALYDWLNLKAKGKYYVYGHGYGSCSSFMPWPTGVRSDPLGSEPWRRTPFKAVQFSNPLKLIVLPFVPEMFPGLCCHGHTLEASIRPGKIFSDDVRPAPSPHHLGLQRVFRCAWNGFLRKLVMGQSCVHALHFPRVVCKCEVFKWKYSKASREILRTNILMLGMKLSLKSF